MNAHEKSNANCWQQDMRVHENHYVKWEGVAGLRARALHFNSKFRYIIFLNIKWKYRC